MRLEEHVWHEGRANKVRAQLTILGIGMRPEIGIWIAIEAVAHDAREIIGDKSCPEAKALIDHGIEVIRTGIEGEADRIAQTRSKGRLRMAIGAELLNRCARPWEIGRAHV